MNNKAYISATANPPSPIEAFTSEVFATADIAVKCVICEEYTSMNSCDRRTRGVFICDKCKTAIKHVRDYLENGNSLT